MSDYTPTTTQSGTNPDGSPHYVVDLSDHPGMQGEDITQHTHLIVMTPDTFNGAVTTADGTTYSVAPKYIAVPVEHIDEVVGLIHGVGQTLGLVDTPPPAVGPVQAARDAFVSAGWTPPTSAV